MAEKHGNGPAKKYGLKFRLPLHVKVCILSMAFVITSVGAVTAMNVAAYRQRVISSYADVAASVAVSVAYSFNSAEFLAAFGGDGEDEFWRSHQAELKNIWDAKENITFVYLMLPHDDESFAYFTSANFPEFRGIVEDPGVTGQEPLQAMRERRVVTTGPVHAGEYGTLISAFAPVLDGTGRPFAVVGADIDVGHVRAAVVNFVMVASVLGLVAAVLFGLIAQFFISRTLNKAIRRVISVDIHSQSDVDGFKARARDEYSNDAISSLYAHFDGLLSGISSLHTDLYMMSTWHMAGKYEYRINADNYKGYHRRVIKNINAFTESYVSSFIDLLDVVGKYGNGDFAANVKEYPENWRWANDRVNELRAKFVQITSQIDTLAKSASEGDLSARIEHSEFSGSWAEVSKNLNNLMEAVANPLTRISENVIIMSKGDFSHLGGSYPGIFGELQRACNTVNKTTAALIEEISHVLKCVSLGDLTVKLQNEYIGTYAPIETALKDILHALDNTMRDVGRVADNVSKSSALLSENAEGLSAGVASHLKSMQALTDGLGSVERRSMSNSSNAEKAVELVGASKLRAENTNDVMGMLLTSMDEIDTSSKKITEITKVIESIAFQISLLSLNASIEASRAGVHGLGFSVVAEEVRTLAAKSNDAAKKTAEIILGARASVENGIQQVGKMAESLRETVEDVTGISEVVGNIRESSRRQSAAITGINKSLAEINDVTRQATDASLNTAAAATELDGQIDFLRQKLAFFKTSLHTLPTENELIARNLIGISPDIQRMVDVAYAQTTCKNGDIIIREGDTADHSMFIVMDGFVDVYKNYGKTSQVHLATISQGNIVGEMALFLKEPRTATIVARDGAKLLEVRQESMYKFIDDYPDIAYTMIESLCSRLLGLLRTLGLENK